MRKLDCVRQKIDDDLQVASFITNKSFKQRHFSFFNASIKRDVLEVSKMLDY
jgi:hypothetical protein